MGIMNVPEELEEVQVQKEETILQQPQSLPQAPAEPVPEVQLSVPVKYTDMYYCAIFTGCLFSVAFGGLSQRNTIFVIQIHQFHGKPPHWRRAVR